MRRATLTPRTTTLIGTETALRELLGKGTDARLLREMIGFAAARLTELEVDGVAGAAHGERSPDRLAQRNDYRERDCENQAGTVELRIPRLRRESYFPFLLVSQRTIEKALTAVIQKAYIHGVSTRWWTIWCRPWGYRASARARCRNCVPNRRKASAHF